LPDNKTQTGIKSNSTGGGGGYNELMFEDAAGKELVNIQAQRNLNKLVKNDEHVTIGNNRTKSVKVDDSLSVGENRSKSIGKVDSTTVGTKHVVTVAPPAPEPGVPPPQPTTVGTMVDKKVQYTTGKATLTLEDTDITLDATTTLKLKGRIIVLEAADLLIARCKGGNVMIKGGPNVLINTDPPKVTTGLGKDVDDLVAKSPTLAEKLADLQKKGWTIKYGQPGAGTYANRDTKEIVVDPNGKGNPAGVVQSLAHESGHAGYSLEPEVPQGSLTKDQYVQQNVNRHLKDEGEATLTNIQVAEEIKANGGPDIGIAGVNGPKYQDIYDKYPDPADRDKARNEIGQVYGTGEHTSTNGQTYNDYYGAYYKNKYVPKSPSP